MNVLFSKKNMLIIIPILLVAAIIITSAFVLIELNDARQTDADSVNSNAGYVSPDLNPDDTFTAELGTYVKKVPNSIRSAKIIPGVDFLSNEESELEDIMQEIDKLIASIKGDNLNAVNVIVNTEKFCLFDAEGIETKYGNLLHLIYTLAHSQNMTVITTVNLGLFANNNVVEINDIKRISKILSSDSLTANTDMIVFDGYYLDENAINADGLTLALNNAMKEYYISILKQNTSIYTGIAADGFFKKNEQTKKYEFYNKGLADIEKWISESYCDFIFVSLPYSSDSKEYSFKTALNQWNEKFNDKTDLYFEVYYSLLGSNKEWVKTDIIVEQLVTLSKNASLNFCFDSYSAFKNDKSESRPAVLKYLLGDIAGNYILKELSVSAPTKTTFTTYENKISIIGASDPEFKLLLNGEVVDRNELGYFSVDLDLELGLNTFKFEHKGVSKTFKITYKKVNIKTVSPTEAIKLEGGNTIGVSVTALANSTVTATLNGTVINLTEDEILDELGHPTEYSTYTGEFLLPYVYDKDKNLGTINFKSVSSYGTENKSGGKVTIKKSDENEISTTLIAEVIVDSAETFNLNDSDRSRPTNSYLPKGTVDYCAKGVTSYEGGITVRNLRYGRAVYNVHKGSSPIKIYEGELPDHNEINIASIVNNGRYTTITLDSLWKAPFLFDIKDQEYNKNVVGTGNRDFTVKEITYSYIDITFSYCTVATGSVVFDNNPIFKSGEWIKNEKDCTLRLYLNKVGAFYGWKSAYNENNQLVFSFLNPVKITEDTTNKYGYSLKGVTIVVDAGHGGTDPGSYGFIKDPIEINGEKIKVYEHYLNLILAKKVKAELEAMGATVILTREDNNTTLPNQQRIAFAKAQNPDFILSIHRNGAGDDKGNPYSEPNGFNTYHFNAFSSSAANLMYDATAKENLYPVSKWSGVKSHVFYMCRITDCPVVLTENGYMTNEVNFTDMIKDEFNQKCAEALAQGVLDYFISIQ